jgi:ferredoxin-NADP reductase
VSEIALLIGDGVGITPICALFNSLASPGVTLILRVNTVEDVRFRKELAGIAEDTGANVHYLVGPPGSDNDPFVGDRLRQLVPDVAHRDVYLCGLPAFMTVAKERLAAAGVPKRHIHADLDG